MFLIICEYDDSHFFANTKNTILLLKIILKMKSDLNLKKQIEKAFEASLLLEHCSIMAELNQGIAILSGDVDQYCKKEVAKKIAKDVEGVKLVIDNLTVFVKGIITDYVITTAIEEKFQKNFGNAHQNVKATVKEGYVWLDGRLNWKYQKELAVECISCIEGIKFIENNIFVPESTELQISEKDVLASIYGDYSIISDIKVEIFGHKVILKGSVENINQKNLVTRLVRTVQGVREVENFLTIKKTH